ncbi:MAG: hypothetical protein ACYCQI_15140 [Gammaproteobacteria bacterium]
MLFRSKEKEDTISSAQHCENMQKRLAAYKALEIKASDEKDEACSKELEENILNGIKTLKDCENQYLKTIHDLSSAASAANREIFKKYGNDSIPTPVGPKSLALIEMNYLPYYTDSQKVELKAYFKVETLLLKEFSKGKKKEYLEKAKLTQEATEKFRKENPEFAKQVDAARTPAAIKNVNKSDHSFLPAPTCLTDHIRA